MRVKPTLFNISLVITIILMFIAYQTRGYFAVGGEILIPVFAGVLQFALKGRVK